jgi:carboxylesterase type B
MLSAPTNVNSSRRIFKNQVFGYQGSFGPTIDGVTLTDSVTRLFKKGRVANVPVIAGSTTDEGWDGYINATQQNPTPQNTTSLHPSTNQITNLTDAQVDEIASFYPVSTGYGSNTGDNFFPNVFHAYWMGLGLFGEVGIYGSERMFGRWLSAAHGQDRVWTYRFNAPRKQDILTCPTKACWLTTVTPGVGTNHTGPYPLAPATHSSENSYLNEPLSRMTDFEHALALEFRTYMSSFIRTGNPNKHKLDIAPTWPSYGALGDFVNSPVRLVPQFAFASNSNKSFPTSTQIEVAPKAGLQRTDFWMSERMLDSTRF